jgi:hypothetical protein
VGKPSQEKFTVNLFDQEGTEATAFYILKLQSPPLSIGYVSNHPNNQCGSRKLAVTWTQTQCIGLYDGEFGPRWRGKWRALPFRNYSLTSQKKGKTRCLWRCVGGWNRNQHGQGMQDHSMPATHPPVDCFILTAFYTFSTLHLVEIQPLLKGHFPFLHKYLKSTTTMREHATRWAMGSAGGRYMKMAPTCTMLPGPHM